MWYMLVWLVLSILVAIAIGIFIFYGRVGEKTLGPYEKKRRKR